MLNQPTLTKLETLRLHGMAEAFRAQADPAQRDGLAALSFEERFALLLDQEWTWRQNRALARRLTQAKFRYRASVEETGIDSQKSKISRQEQRELRCVQAVGSRYSHLSNCLG
jgi:IstB-like ATP binding protein